METHDRIILTFTLLLYSRIHSQPFDFFWRLVRSEMKADCNIKREKPGGEPHTHTSPLQVASRVKIVEKDMIKFTLTFTPLLCSTSTRPAVRKTTP